MIWLEQKIREEKAGKGSWGHGAETPSDREKRLYVSAGNLLIIFRVQE